MKEVKFECGFCADSYEKQANEQLSTFGTKSKIIQELSDCIHYLRIHGILTESEYDNHMHDLIQDWMIPNIRRMTGKEIEDYQAEKLREDHEHDFNVKV